MGEIERKGDLSLKNLYHTALKEPPKLEFSEEFVFEDEYITDDKSVSFRHNIAEGMTGRLSFFVQNIYYHRPTVIYSEPAWNHGYQIFCERAGLEYHDGDYEKYLTGIKRVIDILSIPTYLIIGKKMSKILEPEDAWPISLRGTPALVAVWNIKQLKEPRSVLYGMKNTDVIEYVVDNYDCILDFCCGFGNIIEPAFKKGKRVICSDINADCIHYIGHRFMGY